MFTLLHYVASYVIYRCLGRMVSLPGLILGSMVSDLEIPVLTLLGFPRDRLVLHSLLGSIMLAPLLSRLVRPVYVHIVTLVCKCRVEVGDDVKFYASASVASLSHVVIDSMHHPYNPLFWPVSYASVDYIVLYGDYVLASYVLHFIFLTAAVLLLLRFALSVERVGFIRACLEALIGS